MTTPAPRLWPYLVLCGAAATWIDLGTLHRLHHADSLLPILISFQHWTPYFWEQDRYGMLVPLLASPLTDPFRNLLAQGFLDVACGLAAFFLLARYTLRDASYPLAAALGASTFLAMAPVAYRFDYFLDAAYGVWLAIGLGALILIEDRPGSLFVGRWGIALVLVVLAHWVYSAAAIPLGMLVIGRAVFHRPPRPDDRRRGLIEGAVGSEAGRSLALLGFGLVVGMLLSLLSPDRTTTYATMRPFVWPLAWSRLLVSTWASLAPQVWPAFLASSAAIGLIVGRRTSPSTAQKAAGALTAAAIGTALLVGTRAWSEINLFPPRYLIPSVMFLQCALAGIAVAPLRESASGRRWPIVLAASALLAGSAIGYGRPSPTAIRDDLDRRFGARTADVLAARCTHIAGDFWSVWPAVFHANLAIHDRGERRWIWGVTQRSHPTLHLFRQVPRSALCVAVPIGDTLAPNWLASYLFPPMIEVARRPTVRILRPAPLPPSGRDAWSIDTRGGLL